MTVIHIVGNRPQFIKLSLFYKALSNKPGVNQRIIHTGQHYDPLMSDIFFTELRIPAPDYELGLNQMVHYQMIARMIEQIGEILMNVQPTGVIVYGDTNTTLSGAIAAKKCGFQIAHVEAGIRTSNSMMPEESNRRITDHLADINFCPTELTYSNLCREMNPKSNAAKNYFTGDIMLDGWLYARKIIETSTLNVELPEKEFILVTIHREENNSSIEKLSAIIKALNELNHEMPVVFPSHPKTLKEITKVELAMSFKPIEPLSHLEMIKALSKAKYVITDSGGLAREAYFSDKPTLVIMESVFWPEILENGRCIQCSADTNEIIASFKSLGNNSARINNSTFGNGSAANQMADILEEQWKK